MKGNKTSASKGKILWQGKPELKPFILAASFFIISLLLFSMLFYVVIANIPSCQIGFQNSSQNQCQGFAITLLLAVWTLTVFVLGYSFLTRKTSTYIVSSQGIFIESQILWKHVKVINYKEILRFIQLRRIQDIPYSTGSILIDSNSALFAKKRARRKSKNAFLHIKEPQKVFKILESQLSKNSTA